MNNIKYSYKLIFTSFCPNCPSVKKFMSEQSIPGMLIDASGKDGYDLAKNLNVITVPTVIFFDGDKEIGRASNVLECEKLLENVSI